MYDICYGFTRNTLETSHKGEVVLAGKLRPNGSIDPTIWIGNWIESVSRPEIGVIRITIKDKFRQIPGDHSSVITLQYNGTNPYLIYILTINWNTGLIDIKIRNFVTGFTADIPSDPDTWINVLHIIKHARVYDGDNLVLEPGL